MVYSFLDTSAILNGALKQYKDAYISPLTLTELENIKTSYNKSEEVKQAARKAVQEIIKNKNISYNITFPQRAIDKLLKKYNFLSDINDHRILCEAEYLGQQINVKVLFITSDGTQYLFSQQLPHLSSIYYENNNNNTIDEYCGWNKYYPDESTLNLLYSSPKLNTLKCKTNEFIEIFEGVNLRDIQFWTGKTYRPLIYKEIKNKFLGETVRPRNIEQKMAFDLLQNSNIPVKLLIGAPGVGKDYLMLLHALDLVQRQEKEKIIFIRNLVPFKDAPEIGFLAGDLQEKIAWGLGPISSILGEEGLQQYQEQGLIEAVNLGFIRGCSWDNTIIYVSEGQNITGGGYKLLVSRCGKNSELWINGDILQTDDKKFSENNGLMRLITSLSDNPLFGMVKLIKTERSPVADLARII